MKIMTALALAVLGATLLTACTRDAQGVNAQQIEQQYGVSGAYTDTIATSDGPVKGTLVPITLANGRQGHLFIPQKQTNDPHAVYLRDEQGLHPVQLRDNVSRDELARSPGIVETRPEPQHANKRSWEKEALIIGGSEISDRTVTIRSPDPPNTRNAASAAGNFDPASTRSGTTYNTAALTST